MLCEAQICEEKSVFHIKDFTFQLTTYIGFFKEDYYV